MAEDPYVVLGLSPGASTEQIRAAYRRMAQIYHPDRYLSAPADVRAEAERRMKLVNAAYDVLRTRPGGATAASGGPAPGRPGPGGPRTAGSTSAGPTADERSERAAATYRGSACEVCGHAPTANVTLKEGVGYILFRRVRVASGELCRDCGIAMFRQAQAGTLLKGWWGLIAFFANLAYILQNVSARQTLLRLSPPRRTPRSAVTPRSRPLALGRPVWLRTGFLVTVSIAVLFVLGSMSNGSIGSGSPTSPSTFSPPVASFSLGDCGSVASGYVYRTDCTDPTASLSVVSVLPASGDAKTQCPAGADSYTATTTQVVCWEETG